MRWHCVLHDDDQAGTLSTDSTGRNVDGAGHTIDASGISGNGPFPRHCSGKNENHGHSTGLGHSFRNVHYPTDGPDQLPPFGR